MTHPPCTICGGLDYHARGLCHTCYAQARRRELGAQPRTKRGERKCDECDSDHYALGKCVRHYLRQKRVDAAATPKPRTIRKPRADKGQPRTKRPKSNMPAGWDRRAEPTRGGSDKTPMQKEIGPVQPLGTRIIDAALAKLAEKDALDLADMLGLVA